MHFSKEARAILFLTNLFFAVIATLILNYVYGTTLIIAIPVFLLVWFLIPEAWFNNERIDKKKLQEDVAFKVAEAQHRAHELIRRIK